MADKEKETGDTPSARADVAAQQAASTTGASQADVAASKRLAEAETTTDMGQAEAYIVNLKRVVASEQNLDAFLNAANQAFHTRLLNIAGQFDSALATITTRLLDESANESGRRKANSTTLDFNESNRTLREGDSMGITRIAMTSENPIFQDVISQAAAILASSVASAKKEETK